MIASNEDLKDSLAPSAPFPKPCLSYWQRTTRAYPHLNINKSTPVPASRKYVIIGSGISGALTAFELTENGIDGKEIVILEAREAASGASSRNAGHVRPGMFPIITSFSFNRNEIIAEMAQMLSEDSNTTPLSTAQSKP